MFWLVMYSSACQRVSQRERLPTLTLPATAPSFGSEKWRSEFADGVGLDFGVGVDGDDDFGVALRHGAAAARRICRD